MRQAAASPQPRASSPHCHRKSRRCGMARASGSISSGSSTVADWVSTHLGTGPVVEESFQGGSSWSSAYMLKTAQGACYFAKTARGRDESMFRGEALGLQAMYDTGTIRIPKVFHYGMLEGPGRPGSFIVMEYLDLSGSVNQAELGRKLAQMHLATPSDPNAAAGMFGFSVDNTIGGTHQPNTWTSSWIDFFREQRLGHVIQLAGDTQMTRLGQQLLPRLEHFFEGAGEIRPATLHGDLWSGNIGGGKKGEPVIYDPAVYYGHHEAEFGMMWCAGLSPAFWKAYDALIPRAPGWEERNQLYQLYHYINHYVMFGGGYHGTSTRIMQSLIEKL